MSTIPSNWLGSILQTQGAQARAGVDKQKDATAQAERTGAPSFADKLQDVIEETDRDSQVYSDAEGPGSQGRPSEEAESASPDVFTDEQHDADGLDVQA